MTTGPMPSHYLTAEEIREFQNTVRDLLVAAVDAAGGQGHRIDGAGEDSGAWTDLTIAEIIQGLAMIADQREWIPLSLASPPDGEPVLWHRVPVCEPPVVASLLDTDFVVADYTHWQRLSPLPKEMGKP